MALKIWLPLNKDYKYIYDGVKKDLTVTSHQIKSFTSPIGSYADYNVSTSGRLVIPQGENSIKGKKNASACIWAYNFKTSSQCLFNIFKANAYFAFGIWNNGFFLRTAKTGDSNSTTYGPQRFIELGTPQINTWVHYAITFDNGLAKGYVNGNFVGSGLTFQGDSLLTDSNICTIGGYNTTYPFSGYLCDFRVYDNTLTEEDVKRIYQQKLFELVPYSGVKDVLFDRSGFMNMPLVNNGAEFNANYLYFDGTNDQLRPKVTNDGFNISGGTLSIWFTPAEKPNKNRLIYTDVNSHMAIGFSSTGKSLVVRCGTSNGNTNDFSTTGISWGELNNVVVTYNNTMPQICLVNGIIPSVYSSTSTGFTETARKGLTIGGRQYNTTSRFDGKIYKVAVYNRQFTQNEAVELYNSERGMFLPDDYIQLEYIESNTGQTCYINTGVKINNINQNKLRLEIDGNFGTNASWRVDGLSKTISNIHTARYVGLNSSAKLSYGNNSYVSTSFTETDLTGRHLYVIDYKNGQLKRDNVLVTDFRPYNYTHIFEDDLFIFSWKSDATKQKSAKKYGVKIYLDDVLQFNGIPAKRKSDNVIGMYDMVTGNFFTNSGSGSFTGA